MPRVISIHEYQLKDGVSGKDFEHAVHIARHRGLFDLPGMASWMFLHGVRGKRQNMYAAVWVYDNLQSWEALWGVLDQPIPKSEYPESWQIWEQEILTPLLDCPPDEIEFTAYIEVKSESI